MGVLQLALEAIGRKDGDLYAVDLDDGGEILFRLPGIREARQYSILLQLSATESEKSAIFEAIFRRVVEDEWMATKDSNLRAGVPETIAKLVLLMSGLDDNAQQYTQELFDMYREHSATDMAYMKRIICSTFPAYTFESLESLHFHELIYVFIQAEKVLMDKGIIEKEHSFKGPEETKVKPFLVEDVIKQDAQAYEQYEKPRDEDPRALAAMASLREEAKERAQREEQEFRRGYRRGR